MFSSDDDWKKRFIFSKFVINYNVNPYNSDHFFSKLDKSFIFRSLPIKIIWYMKKYSSNYAQIKYILMDIDSILN